MTAAVYTPTVGALARIREAANIPDVLLGDHVEVLRIKRIPGTVLRVTAFGMVEVDFGAAGTYWFHLGALEAADN